MHIYKHLKYYINKSRKVPYNICAINYLFMFHLNKIYLKTIYLYKVQYTYAHLTKIGVPYVKLNIAWRLFSP